MGAVLAAQGRLSIGGVVVDGILAAVLGNLTAYYIWATYGRQLLSTRVVARIYTPEKVAVAEKLFARRGAWLAVAGGRWIAILRIFGGPLAGLHRMGRISFLSASIAGAVTWVPFIVIVGVILGNNINVAVAFISHVGLILLGLAILAVIAAILWYRYWYLARKHARGTGGPSGKNKLT